MVSRVRKLQSSLAQQAAAGADADRVAAAAVAAWRSIDGALTPIIGRGGVSALFARSLYLASAQYPPLISAHDDALLSGDFAALPAVYSASSGAEAAAAHGALLVCFCGLLTGLIGEPLSDRLLQPVWDTFHRADSAEDDAS